MWFYRDQAVQAVMGALALSIALFMAGVVAYGTDHKVLAVVLFVGGVLFLVVAGLGCVLLVLERWAGASRLVASLPLPKTWLATFRKEAIEVCYRPDPQNYVHLYVKNNRRTDDFITQVLEVEGAEGKQTVPWSVKWRGHPDEQRPIVTAMGQLLDLAQLTPPAPHPQVKDAWQRGEFRFFSTSKPDGWVVHAGPAEVVGPLEAITEALKRHDYFDEALTLNIKVMSSKAGNTTIKKVKLGFNRPFKEHRADDGSLIVERQHDPIYVEIENWPKQ